MIINHNMMSMNAHRSMGVNSGGMSKSIEKLSTGQRINRASDDAAGLAISEKMRSQIRGMNQAARNAQDGISVVQTAEGALDEVHAMLQRMKELAVQSGSDSNQNLVDREAIQQEVNDLADEINSISTKTQFNKMNLLDGTFAGKDFHVGANKDQKITLNIDKMDIEGLGLKAGDKEGIGGTRSVYTSTNVVANVQSGDNNKQFKVQIAGGTEHEITLATGDTVNKIAEKINEKIGDEGTASVKDGKLVITSAKEGVVINLTDGTTNGGLALVTGTNVKGKDSTKQVDWKGVNVLTKEGANKAMDDIQKSIETLSSRRAKLGAIQNRMEHTIKNLKNSAENLQSAESRIRDVDMAKQMSDFTKDNILTQASQAMLAQANQLPQQVLQLLR